jgi:hypothetical protein
MKVIYNYHSVSGSNSDMELIYLIDLTEITSYDYFSRYHHPFIDFHLFYLIHFEVSY